MTDDSIRTDDLSHGEGADAPETQATDPNVDTNNTEAMDAGPVHTRRSDRMAKLAEKSKEARDASAREMGFEPPPKADSPAELNSDERAKLEEAGALETSQPNEAKGASEDRPRAEEQSPGSWETREDGSRVKRLKVNGEFRELTEAEYDRYLAKELSGDQKLMHAQRVAQQLQEREQQIARREQEIRDAMQRQAEKPPEPQVDLTDLSHKYHEAIFEGDTDEASALLLKIQEAGRGSSTPNLDQLRKDVSIQVRQEIAEQAYSDSVQEGWMKFQETYPELAESNRWLAATDTIIREVQQENPNLNPKDLIMKAGEIAYKELKPIIKGSNSEEEVRSVDTQARAERESRKANLTPIPRAGSKRTEVRGEPEIDMSPAAKLARMRQARAV